MSDIIKVNLPISEEDADRLKCGDRVLLSGKVFSARDAAHKKLYDAIMLGEAAPIDLDGIAIYYVGACPNRSGEAIGSCGPTTAGRMDKYAPLLFDSGVKAVIGKGKRNLEVQNSIIKNRAVYFAAIGGAGALYADCIKKNELIAYPELLSEAIHEMEFKDFPAIVAIDSAGGNIYGGDKNKI